MRLGPMVGPWGGSKCVAGPAVGVALAGAAKAIRYTSFGCGVGTTLFRAVFLFALVSVTVWECEWCAWECIEAEMGQL